MPHAVARFAPGRAPGWLAVDPELHLRMVQAWIDGQQPPAELVTETTPWSRRRWLVCWVGPSPSSKALHDEDDAPQPAGGDDMLRWLLIVFLVAHGLVHVAIWAPRYDPEKAAFDASHSWLIGHRRVLAQVLAFPAAALLVLAGIALWANVGWWRPTAVVGLGVSTVLLLLYFTPWYLFILAVNIALIVGIAFMDWPAKSTVGA